MENLIFGAFATLEGYREGDAANLGRQVYDRCTVVALCSAKVCNPSCTVALVTNVPLPQPYLGQLTAAGDSLSLVLEDISVRAAGMELFALEAEYYVGPCEGIELSADGARMILEMSEPELMEWAMDLEREAQDWLYDMEELLYGRLPQELLWSLMYGFY